MAGETGGLLARRAANGVGGRDVSDGSRGHSPSIVPGAQGFRPATGDEGDLVSCKTQMAGWKITLFGWRGMEA